jgi:hypothetical protein
MSATYLFLVIFWVFMVLGLVMEGYDDISRSHNSSYLPTPVGTIIYKKVILPVWQLWVLLVIITVFGPFYMKSFYDHHVATLNYLLILIACEGFLLSHLAYHFFINTPNLASIFLTFVFVVTFILILLLPLVVFFPGISRDIQTLNAEPEFAKGMVHGKYITHGSRGGTFYHVTIDGIHYQTPDPGWYRTIQVGTEIEYAFSPFYASVFQTSPPIFNPQNIGLTSSGIFLFFCGALFWLIVSCLTFGGWYSLLYRQKYS